ncbi:alpha-2-macroglobulin family protein [Bacterioplanoides sp.]|uniref:alpha-2-macroglobulin family protein n=1 Tax=Bacterioplanoides sp. TaxID=2066072 RepID=UPI003B593096
MTDNATDKTDNEPEKKGIVARLLLILTAPLRMLFRVLLGSVNWSAPTWLKWSNKFRRSRPLAFYFLLVAAFAGYQHQYFYELYHKLWPQPLSVYAEVSVPGLPGRHHGATPKKLRLDFRFDKRSLSQRKDKTSWYPSAAPLKNIGEQVTRGIRMFPEKAGVWRWDNQNTLIFTPKQHWPAGQEYEITLAPELIQKDLQLAKTEYSFETRKFTAKIKDMELYNDPLDRSVKNLVATVSFSHPVQQQALNELISLQEKHDGVTAGRRFNFDVTFSDNGYDAYIKSAPIKLPQQEAYVFLTVSDDVANAAKTTTLGKDVKRKMLLPDTSSFMKVRDARSQIVRNKDNDPEQVITVSLTDHVSEDEFKQRLNLYMLPRHRSVGYIRKNGYSNARKIRYELIPNAEPTADVYNLRIDEAGRKYLYLRVEKGLKSVSGFAMTKAYEDVLSTPDYPKELDIAGEGSLLSLAGDKALSFSARGINEIRVSIYRLLDDQLNHFVTQTYGDIDELKFSNYNFNKYNLTRSFQKRLFLSGNSPKKVKYASLSLAQYLKSQNAGIFIIEAEGYQKDRDYSVIKDKRIVMVTDLGIMLKKAADGQQFVYVQSVKTGKPVAGARVKLLGRNGIPVFSATTNTQGWVAFASADRYRNEREPVAYLVSYGNDSSYLPYNRHQRRIDFSGFDIDGEYGGNNSGKNLKGFLFSDRGIYRPGETVSLGVMVRQENMQVKAGIPLELSIHDPKGNVVLKERMAVPENGLFDLEMPTTAATPTGDYEAHLYRVNKRGYTSVHLGQTNFSVEEFQPDSMKIRTELVPGVSKGWYSLAQAEVAAATDLKADLKTGLKAKVQLKNLFGTPAQNRRVEAAIELKPVTFAFREFSDYRFTDPLRHNKARNGRLNQTLPGAQSDNEGMAEFDISLQQFDKGTYRLTFYGEGYEPGGGRSVTAQSEMLVSPLSLLVGHKADGQLKYLKKDQQRHVHFIALNPQLEKQAMKGLKLVRIKKQPISSLVRQENGLYAYQTVIRDVEMSSDDFEFDSNGGQYALDTSEPGDYQLSLYSADDELLSRFKYNVAGSANLAGRLEKNAELSIRLNKNDYKAGEEIEVNIIAPYTGSGLISIESNTVHAQKWFTSTTNSSVQTIRVPPGLEGNAYVNVAFVRSLDSQEIFTSPLSYAVVPFNIDRSSRVMDIKLEAPERVEPGQKVAINYSSDKPGNIIVFAVDEGILQVADYQQPKPLNHFMKKKALQVSSFQILDMILPEYSVFRNLAGVGGGSPMADDLLGANLNPFARTLDKPAVFWSGVMGVDNKTRSAEFIVPDSFSGNLKIMAVAANESSLGIAQQYTLVRGSFVLSPNVLTVAAPGDEFDVTLGVANLVPGVADKGKVQVSLQLSDNLALAANHSQETGLTQKAGLTTELNIAEGNEGRTDFRIKALNNPGEGRLVFTAQYIDEQGVPGRKTSRVATLSVRPAQTFRTRVASGFDDSGNAETKLPFALYPDFASQSISASSSPMVMAGGLSQFLDNYPHGCTEQIVSRVFPWLGLAASQTDAAMQQKTRDHVKRVIGTLYSRQTSEGGFNMWPGYYGSHFASLYATHFLLDAKAYGYAVEKELISSTVEYLRRIARQQANGRVAQRHRAMAIYLLARAQEIPTNYLIDLHDTLKSQGESWQKDIMAMYMAATYQLLKKHDEAAAMVEQFGFDNKVEEPTDFQSDLTVNAQYVYLVSAHFPKIQQQLDVENTIMPLLQPLMRGRFNTISASYTTMALQAYSRQNRARYGDETADTFRFVVKDKDGKEIQLDNLALSSTVIFPTANIPLNQNTPVSDEILIRGENPVFYQASQSGFPAVMPAAENSNLEVVHQLLNKDGKEITTLRQGEEAVVRLRIRTLNGRQVDNIAVIDLLPGGFEVIRESVPRQSNHWNSDYVDVREDRVIFYGGFGSSVTELEYRIKATAAGEFIAPPAYAESMYDPDIWSQSAAATITVVNDE